ncbi:hypothetical protein ACWEQ4_01365 [Rhodococcus sp. NPDC003994]
MAHAGDFVSRNAKAVVSAIGGVIAVGTSAASLIAFVPDNLLPAAVTVSSVLGVLEVLRTVNVWLVKNGPVVAELADGAEELIEGIVDGFGSLGDRPAAPVAS